MALNRFYPIYITNGQARNISNRSSNHAHDCKKLNREFWFFPSIVTSKYGRGQKIISSILKLDFPFSEVILLSRVVGTRTD